MPHTPASRPRPHRLTACADAAETSLWDVRGKQTPLGGVSLAPLQALKTQRPCVDQSSGLIFAISNRDYSTQNYGNG